jgi:hypothetical protein
MIFSKIFFGVSLAQKNYKMQKSEFGKCRWNPATSGCRCRIPARKFDRIRPKWMDSGRKLPDQVISGQIRPDLWQDPWPDPNRFGQIRPTWLESGNIPTGIWWPDSDDQMLSDSDAGWISTIDNC